MQPKSEYIGIVKTDVVLGHFVMLQNYTDYFYLRVESDCGAGILKLKLSRLGECLKTWERPPEDEDDFTWVRWAQKLINGLNQ